MNPIKNTPAGVFFVCPAPSFAFLPLKAPKGLRQRNGKTFKVLSMMFPRFYLYPSYSLFVLPTIRNSQVAIILQEKISTRKTDLFGVPHQKTQTLHYMFSLEVPATKIDEFLHDRSLQQ